MIADMRQIIDYMECPMMYRFRYIDRIDPLTTTLRATAYKGEVLQGMEELFDQEIHKIGYHIFNYMQDGGKFPTQGRLRSKWSQLWCRNKEKADILFDTNTELRGGPRKRLEKLGIKVIENIHDKFKETPGVPILVGQKVKIEVGKHVITVIIDLVREIKIDNKPIIEIMDFKTGIKRRSHLTSKPMNLHIHNDLEVTAISMAFHKLTGEREDRITYYDMVGNRELYTKRGQEDYDSLEHILDQVERSIKNEIYYPAMDARCIECPFQAHCSTKPWLGKKV